MWPDFTKLQRSGAIIWIARKYAGQNLIDRLADPDSLFADPSCQVIKDQKKIKVGRLTVDVDGRSQALFVKRYNMSSWRHRVVSPLVSSGARRALRGACILRDAGIRTANPMAAVETRRLGVLRKSFFITEELSGGKTADAYWREVLSSLGGREGWLRRRRFLIQLAALFRSLHDRGIYHNDLKDANIIAVSGRTHDQLELFLLDLEGIRRFRGLSPARKRKNLVQINRTLGRYLRRADKLLFLSNYLKGAPEGGKARRQICRTVVQESSRLDRVKAALAPEFHGAKRARVF